MWLIVSVSNNDIKHTILGDHKYVVGRQSCDIVIPDASVSRRQAVLTMAHYETSVVKSYITPTLTLEDVSKFGTFVNGKAVKNPGGSTVTLKHNDEIKFGGSPSSVVKAVYEPFVATTSCLEKAPKKSLIKVMCLLGGHLVRDWRPICDLLIMSKINVTIKVICAINNQKHIVTPQYLDDLYSHLMGRRDKPDPVSYLPEVVDQEVPAGVSFHPDVRRVTLLQGLKFYFLSAVQFNKTNLAVSTAGGQPILLEDGTEEEAVAMTESKTVVVAVSREILATLSPSCQKFVKLVISVLKRKNLRMVTDPEIGWAILTCNTVDFCNARSSITPDMLSYMASQSISHSTEVDAAHSVQLVDAKPGKRCVTEVQSQRGSFIEDVKPAAKIIKPELMSPPVNTQILKTEPTEEHLEVKKVEVTGNSSEVSQSIPRSSGKEFSQSKLGLKSKEVSQSKQGSSSKLSNLPVFRISESDETTTSLDVQPVEDSLRHGQNTLGYHPKGSQSGATCDTRTDNDVEKNQRINEDDNQDEAVSVFARRQDKIRARPRINNLDDSDDDSGTKNIPTSKRKTVDHFDDDVEVNINKRRKTNHVEGNKHNKDPHSDIIIMSTDIHVERTSATLATSIQEDCHSPDSVQNIHGQSKQGQNSDGLNNSRHRLPPESSHLSAVSGDGWLNMKAVKSKLNHEPGAAQNGDVGEEAKPDVELLRDIDGNPLRNLCHVQVTDLVSRPVISKVKTVVARPNVQGEKNFKKFKKTKHAGAGRLPVIIGGRDLEVYLGRKHKDIEVLFSEGLAQENQRQSDEQKDGDLFDWDDRTRKTISKRIR